jgi:cytochrome c oxidase subunit I
VTLAAKLTAPGWYRAALSVPIGVAVTFAIVLPLRALYGYEPLVDGDALTTVGLITLPLAFLVGIGCFDYWFY